MGGIPFWSQSEKSCPPYMGSSAPCSPDFLEEFFSETELPGNPLHPLTALLFEVMVIVVGWAIFPPSYKAQPYFSGRGFRHPGPLLLFLPYRSVDFRYERSGRLGE